MGTDPAESRKNRSIAPDETGSFSPLLPGVDHVSEEIADPRNVVSRLSTVIGLSVASLFLSVITLFLRALVAYDRAGSPTTTESPIVGGWFLLSVGAVTLSLLAYGVAQLRRYRRYRGSVAEPPPNPFRRPVWFFGVVTTDSEELTEAEWLLQRGGVALLVGLFVTAGIVETFGVG
jgi:hypothetical protein